MEMLFDIVHQFSFNLQKDEVEDPLVPCMGQAQKQLDPTLTIM